MTPTPVFFDTNVLVYIFSVDEPAKLRIAEQLYGSATSDGTATVSTQVIQEFYAATTRRPHRRLSPREARHVAQELAELNVIQLGVPLLLRAMDLNRSDHISFWDALIVEAALAGGCRTLYSEDLQHGRSFGPLRVVNPFVPETNSAR